MLFAASSTEQPRRRRRRRRRQQQQQRQGTVAPRSCPPKILLASRRRCRPTLPRRSSGRSGPRQRALLSPSSSREPSHSRVAEAVVWQQAAGAGCGGRGREPSRPRKDSPTLDGRPALSLVPSPWYSAIEEQRQRVGHAERSAPAAAAATPHRTAGMREREEEQHNPCSYESMHISRRTGTCPGEKRPRHHPVWPNV